MQFYLEIITCDPLIYTTDHPKFIVSYQKEEPISAYRVMKGTTVKLVLSDHSKRFEDQSSLNAGQKYCRML